MIKSNVRGAAAGLLLAVIAAGCGGGGDSGGATDGVSGDSVFLAFASDFKGYRHWNHAPAVPPDGVPMDVVHVKGPWTVYWNDSPPHGATQFPLKTIIVKETDPGVVDPPQIFAMAKRGGNFNAGGAVNWEWFELNQVDGESVTINWHGFGPMTGGGDLYGGDPTVCNNCHALAAKNDYVWSTALQLSSF